MLLCPFKSRAKFEGSYVYFVHINGGLSNLTIGYLRLGKVLDLVDGTRLTSR